MTVETELWEDVRGHDDYEICVQEPHQIGRNNTGKILSESITGKGYYHVKLDGKDYLKHRLAAAQWIYNDDPALKNQVDHINRDKRDNRVNNLRLTTVSENNLKRARFKRHNDYVDELPDDAIEVDHYGNHVDISDLYYHDDALYVSESLTNTKTVVVMTTSK